MSLTDKELLLIEDKDFLISKKSIVSKIEIILNFTNNRIAEIIDRDKLSVFSNPEFMNGKVSKGESYRDLPFLTLDFPRSFEKDSVFAYRTMFWWGNFFSITLHIQGLQLDFYRTKILSNFDMLLHQDIYICVGETPWEYHFGKNNYIKLTINEKDIIKDSPFIKISKKIPLEQIESIPQISSSFFQSLMTVLTK